MTRVRRPARTGTAERYPASPGALQRAVTPAIFNLGADVYAWFTAQPTWRASCAALADAVELSTGPTTPIILDLGCGPGVSTFALARRFPAAGVIGLDRAWRMLLEAQRRAPVDLDRPSGSWVQADAHTLPFATHSVAAVTGHSFLYLLPDRQAALAEVRRVLRPGGSLTLMEPNAQPATVRGTLAVSRDPRHLLSVSLWRPFSRLHGRFTEVSLAATFTRAGFTNCRVTPVLGGLGLLARGSRPAD